MSNKPEEFPSQKVFEEATETQKNVETLASKGELTHEALFDETGHVSEGMGDVAVDIVNGDAAWPTGDAEKGVILDVLSSERSKGTPEDIAADHDAALVEENHGRVEESSLRIAKGTLDEARYEAAKIAGIDPDSPFPDTHPKNGSVEDVKLAAHLGDGVRKVAQKQAERTAVKASKNAISPSAITTDTYFPKKAGDATDKVLRDVIRREPTGFFGKLKGIFRKQSSRTDRVIEGVDHAAHQAGVRAQQAGEAVRAEQERMAAAEQNKSPF